MTGRGRDRQRLRELERQQTVLFPIRLDDAVLQTPEAWARQRRDQRNISDFRQRKDPDADPKALERLLRDLKREQNNW